MLVALVRSILNRSARLKIGRMPGMSVATTATVNWRGIRIRKLFKLTIGDGSIVEGNIVCDREGASISIGNNTFIGNSTIIAADGIDIGDDVLVSWGCYITDHNSHSIYWQQRKDDARHWHAGIKEWDHVVKKKVKICNRAWIGFNSIILKGVTIGQGAIVGAGSVVTKNVDPYTMVAGNPARVIRKMGENDLMNAQCEEELFQ